jgi:hypothetical protein
MALVVGPVAWVLLAFGLDRSSKVLVGADLHANDVTRPLLLLAAAGLLLGIVGALRLSPLGALVLGILYTSSYTLLLVAPERVMDLFNADLSVAGRHADLSTPIQTGTSLIIGVLLLVGSVRAGRRRVPRPAAEPAEPAETAVGIEGLGLRSSYYYAEPETRYAYDAESSSWDRRR